MKILIPFVLLLVISGCAGLPSKNEMKEDTAGWELPHLPPQGEGVVYVVRPSVLGTIVRFNIFLDDKIEENEMGWNRGKQYIYFFVKPGKHKILSVAENTATLEFNVRKGSTTFIHQEASMGFIMARNSLKQIDELEGKYRVKNLSLGEVKKTRLK